MVRRRLQQAPRGLDRIKWHPEMSIRLQRVDMTRARQLPGSEYGWTCPGIVVGERYLVLYDGAFYVGCFSGQWFGLNFDGVYDSGVEFEPPGEGHSEFQGVWRIKVLFPWQKPRD